MQYSYQRALVTFEPAEIEYEIRRIRKMLRPCGWKTEKCAPLYKRLAECKGMSDKWTEREMTDSELTYAMTASGKMYGPSATAILFRACWREFERMYFGRAISDVIEKRVLTPSDGQIIDKRGD